MINKGIVYLIGAGPGDPGLLTLKGKECLERADCVIYDYLANEELLKFARSDAELIYAGKKGGEHKLAQQEINSLIIGKALAGKSVARLKGGDPFIFGRGAEEAEALVAHGIEFEVVPGVSAGYGVPAYAGIPLTHRLYASSYAFITGHEDPAKEGSKIDWARIATGVSTLVFFMGVKNLPKIVQNLIRHGRDPQTPLAVISSGTYPTQKTITGTLATILEIAARENIKPPGIAVVGEVVRLREKLNWFEKKPLFGKRILITRSRKQMSAFACRLHANGAAVIEFPTIEILPPENFVPLDNAIHQIHDYDWLIFTSVNAVDFFIPRLRVCGKDIRDLKSVKIGAIGPVTAAALERLCIKVDVVPQEYRAESIIASLTGAVGDAKKLQGLRILLPRSRIARDILPVELRKFGCQVDVVEAYQTVLPADDHSHIDEMLKNRQIDLVTFTSSSTVGNFAALYKTTDLSKVLAEVDIACIGPITAETAARFNLRSNIIPKEYTIEALTEAIIHHYVKTRP